MFSRLKEIFAISVEKPNRNLRQTIRQCAVIFVALSIILMLYEFLGGIIVASFGASSCILFLTPHTKASRTPNLLGGYLFAAVSGVSFYYLRVAVSYVFEFTELDIVLIIVCASAATLTTFLMAWTRFIHPPSAALALGLAADSNCVQTAAAAIAGIIILCLVRHLLRKHLKNLI